MPLKGECPICQKKGVELREHHVIEAPKEHWKNGKAPRIILCADCHLNHERYRNYLKDIVHIEIDRKKEYGF